MQNCELIEGYLSSERPYDVCAHTTMGGYMEFLRVESGIMFEDNAKMVCDKYAEFWERSANIKSVCVRKGVTIIYEVELK